MFDVGMREQIHLGVMVLLMLLRGNALVMAQEYIRNQEPVPESVDHVVSPIELSFKEKPKIPRFFPRLKDRLKDTPPFSMGAQNHGGND